MAFTKIHKMIIEKKGLSPQCKFIFKGIHYLLTINNLIIIKQKTKIMEARVKVGQLQLKCAISLLAVFMLIPEVMSAQDQDSRETIFNPDLRVSELWTPEVKINSMQGDLGTLIGFYGGALINRTFLIGISGGVNLGHPRINYGYFGGLGQIIIKPEKLVHMSGQLLVAFGTTKDYENPKNGIFDNFWNISGAGFFMLEPGINIEINLSTKLTMVTGISYRSVSGLNPDDEDISITHVTNNDLSGLNLNIGLKINKPPKK